MNGFTRLFLVLLRLAVGWHFLFEGIEKVESVARGPTETNRPWSSEGYFREASGPLGVFIRNQITSEDSELFERLRLQPLPAGSDPAKTPLHLRISPALASDFDRYFEQFCAHYELDRDQRILAEAKLAQAKEQVVHWLLHGSKQVERNLAGTTFKKKTTTEERIAELAKKLNEIDDIVQRKLPAFNADVEKQNLRTLKAEAGRMRTELLSEAQQPLVEGLKSLLTKEQLQSRGPIPDGQVREPEEQGRLYWLDFATRWGLVTIGGCLLIGLFTRTAAFAGAIFLLFLYLSMPPFPWLPEQIRVEGHYFFVNKNFIEMLALLVLATTRSGRWLGLDGLVQFLNPWRAKAQEAVAN